MPYANFWAWFWVIFFFSLGYRIFARREDWGGTWISPVLGYIIGLVGVLATNAFIVFVVPMDYRPAVVAITLVVALVLVFGVTPAVLSEGSPLAGVLGSVSYTCVYFGCRVDLRHHS